MDLSIPVQIKPFCEAGQDAGLPRHSSHQPLWTQSAKLTSDSIGDGGEIAGVSPLRGVSWLNVGTKTPSSGTYDVSEPEFVNFKGAQESIQGIDSASLCTLAESIPGLLKHLQIRAQASALPLCLRRPFHIFVKGDMAADKGNTYQCNNLGTSKQQRNENNCEFCF
jgi:hypothetical protein